MVVLSCKPWPRAFAEGVGKDAEVNAIFGEPLRVLGHDALFEPIRNLLHRAHQGLAMAQPIFRPRPQKVYTD